MELRNVCRTCLLPGESMQSIFDLVQVPTLEPNKIPILDLLKLFTEISVSSNDDRPDNVCSNCLDKVHRSYTFKIKYEKSESILKQLNDERKNVIELIELEETGDCSVPEMSEHAITNKEVYLVQEVKEEPEIEIVDVDDKVLNGTDFDELTHTEERPFHSDVCSQKFRFKTHLESHLVTAHSDETKHSKKLKCATCFKLFGRKSRLNDHMRIHTGETPFKCEVCPQKFRCLQILKRHIETAHTGRATNSRNFKCSICSKLYESKNSLQRHMKTHTVKLFQCENCPRKYRCRFYLKNHMRVHNDVATVKNKFKCEICRQLVASKSSLNKHMRIHTEEKTIQCKFCPEKFRFYQILYTHLEATHGDSVLNCIAELRRKKVKGCRKN